MEASCGILEKHREVQDGVGLIKRIFLIFMAISLLVGGVSATLVYRWFTSSQFVVKDRDIYFARGTRLSELAGQLEAQGLIDEPLLFHLFVRLQGGYEHFQAGRYRFSGRVSPSDIVDKIRRGEVFRPVLVSLAIPEGFTVSQINQRIASLNLATLEELEGLAKDKAFLTELGIASENIEGYLYPLTYHFYKKPTPRDIYRKMVSHFHAQITGELRNRLKEKGLSLEEAVTFASLIELETIHEDEKPMIAEVIWSRLKNKEPLGIDAAVIYGAKNYQGDLTWKHLKNPKNPYNTRIHRGLPPGPIGSPVKSSFEAILKPTQEGYYYYVLKTDGTKRHQFSKSLKEHNYHVKKLIEATRAQN